MVCVILAYTGYGLGYGVIPCLIAAELMSVEIRYCVQQLQPFLQNLSQIYCGWSAHDPRNYINIPPLKTEVLMVSLGIHGLFTMFAGII